MKKPVKGMILAAGFGTRLRPLTLLRAKPSVPFLARPLIDYSLELFQQAHVEEVVINLHHKKETVIEAVDGFFERSPASDPPLTVRYSVEDEILGTAGCYAKVAHLLRGSDFIVSNGKIYFEQDLLVALDFHRQSDAIVTMVVIPHTGSEPFNPVLMDEAGRVERFALKSEAESFERAFIYTGVQILSDRVLDFIPPGRSEIVTDIYPRLIADGQKVFGFVSPSYWCECSWTSRYLEKTREVLTRKGRENLVPHGVDGNFEGVVASPGSEIAPGCRMRNVVLWEGCRVGPNASLRNAIICAGSEIPAHTTIENAVVTPILSKVPRDLEDQVRLEEGLMIWKLQ
jgi:NDP-sugar pyrophosphorylase family protein